MYSTVRVNDSARTVVGPSFAISGAIAYVRAVRWRRSWIALKMEDPPFEMAFLQTKMEDWKTWVALGRYVSRKYNSRRIYLPGEVYLWELYLLEVYLWEDIPLGGIPPGGVPPAYTSAELYLREV